MDELQSWWEVPAIAHFCYVFRAAFNLLYFEMGELEAAILNIQDPEMCMSLEQLVIRLLQGCYEENEVTSNNWEEKLYELFSDNCEDEENPLENNTFLFLSPRSKVEVLLKLCEFRLDADGALDAIKDIPSDDMQAKCIGKDGQNNLYWYFCDERLYKEDPSVPTKKSGKSEELSRKGKNIIAQKKRGRQLKPPKSDNINKSWSIVCHNLSDWETLVKMFSKSKHKQEKELANEMKKKYLPLLTEVITEKDRLLRKRFLELAPKRMSQRISKVQAQKKMEEQMVEEANEKRRIEMEQERVEKEAAEKKQQKEARMKRAEAREKIVQDRLLRAQQRDLMRGADVNVFSLDNDDKRTNTRSINAQKQTPGDDEDDESSEKASDDDDDDEEEDDASQSESENEHSAKRHSINSEISESDEESNNSEPLKKVYTSNGSSVSSNCAEQNSFGRSNVVHNSYGVSKWNVQDDSKGQRIHILRYAYDGSPSNKRLKPNESTYNIGPTTSPSTNDPRPSYYNESHAYHPLLHRNFNSCSKVTTSSPQVIRIDFIKPPKPQASR